MPLPEKLRQLLQATIGDEPQEEGIQPSMDPMDFIAPHQVAKLGVSSLAKLARAKAMKDVAKSKIPYGAAKAEEFLGAIEAAKKANPRIAENLSPYSVADLEGAKQFLSPDKASGYSIKPGGELVNVFSSSKGRGDELVKSAVDQGALHLDAFDPYLPKLYGKHGFKEVSREPNWTKGGPDVVFMRKPGSLEPVAMGQKELESLNPALARFKATGEMSPQIAQAERRGVKALESISAREEAAAARRTEAMAQGRDLLDESAALQKPTAEGMASRIDKTSVINDEPPTIDLTPMFEELKKKLGKK
mgnify:CR=1 FL=1